MPTQIAFLGSAAMVEQIQEYTKDRTDILVVPFIYNNPKEVVEHIDKAIYCDVLLFSGLLPYYFAQDILTNYKKPCLYIPIDEYMLTISIFQLLYHEGFTLDRISIDVPDRTILLQCLRDNKLCHDGLWIMDYPYIFNKKTSLFSTKKIVEYHEQLHRQGDVDITLTSIHAVYDELQARGIPCKKLIDPKKNIEETIEEAIVKSNIYLTKQSQLAVGYIVLEQELNENVQEIMEYFEKEFQCSIRQIEDGLWSFFSTRGRVEQVTSDFQLSPIHHSMNTVSPYKLGIGFGLSYEEAKRYAKIALLHTKKYEGSHVTFIVTDNGTIIGPLGEKESKTYQLSSYDKKVQEWSKMAGISVAKFNQFLSFVGNLPKNQFTTEDLAQNFSVTRRSAERLLKKLIALELVHKIGEEQPYQSGRPRAIYTFQLK